MHAQHTPVAHRLGRRDGPGAGTPIRRRCRSIRPKSSSHSAWARRRYTPTLKGARGYLGSCRVPWSAELIRSPRTPGLGVGNAWLRGGEASPLAVERSRCIAPSRPTSSALDQESPPSKGPSARPSGRETRQGAITVTSRNDGRRPSSWLITRLRLAGTVPCPSLDRY